jgi:hypothetical protein
MCEVDFLPGRLIGRRGPIEGPPRYPNLKHKLSSSGVQIYSRSRTLTTLNKASALIIQTSHVRHQKVCDVSCSIVSICVSNRRDINLNICFASAFPYKIELKRYPVYTPKGLTLKYLYFAQIIFYVVTYSSFSQETTFSDWSAFCRSDVNQTIINEMD